ncbi:hypothetical protein KKC32_03190 [Patescibacteria group bacterium]|nr:hypothetical protein [Patescibacteria group bacterium]
MKGIIFATFLSIAFLSLPARAETPRPAPASEDEQQFVGLNNDEVRRLLDDFLRLRLRTAPPPEQSKAETRPQVTDRRPRLF